MRLVFGTELLLLFSMIGVLCYVQYRARRMFSIRRIGPALALLVLGQIFEVAVQYMGQPATSSGFAFDSVDQVLAFLANVCEVLGVITLLLGFLRIMQFEVGTKQRIADLEVLLPLCSNCKKYRSDDGVWRPIEKYLSDTGTKQITHGICPDCKAAFYSANDLV